MIWTPVDKYHQRSDCGQYTITMAGATGVFCAWYGPKPLKYTRQEAKAKKAAEDHKEGLRNG